MQRLTKSELQMLRELVWHWGTIEICFFCRQPLLTYAKSEGMTFGHRRHGPVKTKLTIHHKDLNRLNNTPENRKPCHKDCHVRYHANLRRQSSERELDDPDQ